MYSRHWSVVCSRCCKYLLLSMVYCPWNLLYQSLGFFEPVNSFISLPLLKDYRELRYLHLISDPMIFMLPLLLWRGLLSIDFEVFFFLFSLVPFIHSLSFQYSAVLLQHASEWIFHLFSWVCFLYHGLTCSSVLMN